ISNECNYQLDTSNINNYTKKFSVTAKNVDKPTVSGLTSVDYNGAEQGFTINASDDVELTPLDGLRLGDDCKFYAKNVGTYKVKMSLKDDGEAKQWTDLKNTQDREDLALTIKPATLTITFNGDTWSWNSKTEQTVTFSDNRFGSGEGSDKLSFNVSYDFTPISNVTTDHNAKTTTVTIPPLEGKTYSLKVSIKVSNDDASKNYKITGDVAQRSFTVSDKEIEVKESNIKWKYRINNTGSNEVGAWTASTPFSALTYDGKEYSFFSELDGIDANDGVTATCETKKSGSVVEAGKDAGTYTTTVTLSSDKVKFKNNKNTFTLTWEIKKALFDLSEVKWDYTRPLQFNDKEQEVVMTGIPDGLTFTYKNNKKRTVGKYTAEITLITVRNDLKNNYVAPVIPSSGTTSDTYTGDVTWKLSWEIKKGELELEWTPKQEKDVNDKAYSCWESSNYKDKIEYKYYTLEAYADGELTGEPIDKASIIVPDEESEIEYYIVAVVKDTFKSNYEIVGTWAMPFVVGSMATVINVSMASEYTYDG
ncbi:MAG: hypothetical protein K2I23_04435, partial [Clostridia bacterium]|nr:hypothetical protein [Clostridia bacterium]